jgi:hypothetical protein
VVVNPLPDQVFITANPGLNIAEGQSVSLKAVIANGGTNPVYQWLLNGNEVPGAIHATFVNNTYQGNDTVTCIVGSASGCGNYSVSGKVIVSVESLSVVNAGSAERFALLPNPNKGDFMVTGTLSNAVNAKVDIEITDMLGQIVFRNKVVALNGRINEHIQLQAGLANGMYLLNLKAGDDNEVFHFVIEQ